MKDNVFKVFNFIDLLSQVSQVSYAADAVLKLKLNIFHKFEVEVEYLPQALLAQKKLDWKDYCRMSENPEITTESFRVEPAPKPNPGSRRRRRELDWKEGRVHVRHHHFSSFHILWYMCPCADMLLHSSTEALCYQKTSPCKFPHVISKTVSMISVSRFASQPQRNCSPRSSGNDGVADSSAW